MTLFRVSVTGDDLPSPAIESLTAAGAAWEGSTPEDGEIWRHRVLVEAGSEDEAVATVRAVVAGSGSYRDFAASIVTDARGEPWRAPFVRSWQEIDWQADPARAGLTELQRTVLSCLLDDAEPTWIIVADPEIAASRACVEAVLEALQLDGYVQSVLASSGEPGRALEPERWWAATDKAWGMLGLIKSPRYAWWLEGPE
jgi:hypothetical protein